MKTIEAHWVLWGALALSLSACFEAVEPDLDTSSFAMDDNPSERGNVLLGPQVLYWENWGDSQLLNGWHDAGDLKLTGDFAGRGHDQVLLINTNGAGGRVMIVDYESGPDAFYWENWGDSGLLNGWHDPDDLRFAGDFAGKGYDQVLFINRGGAGGRVMIVDYSSGQPDVLYWENWGDSGLLNGWHDLGDLQFVGDFAGTGHDQLLFVNRGGAGGRVMIVDYN